jgi:hypothetical protein
MRGTRIEKEVEICATDITNKGKASLVPQGISSHLEACVTQNPFLC